MSETFRTSTGRSPLSKSGQLADSRPGSEASTQSLEQPPFTPLVRELIPMPDSEAVFTKLASQSHCLFLDSARRDHDLGRYSYIAVDPFDYLEVSPRERNGLDLLQEKMEALASVVRTERCPDLPPFQGGAAGLLGYDLAYSLESLPEVRFDEFQVPAMAVGFYDVVIAFDNQQNRAWIISQGLPHRDQAARQQRAEERLLQFESWVYDTSGDPADVCQVNEVDCLQVDQLSPHCEVPGPAGLLSNFSADQYCRAVARAVDYICAGDVFQVNLSQRLLFPASCDSVALYLRLRRCNAAPFAGYFETNQFQIISASPERFLQVQEDVVEARPIKGTRRRSRHPVVDLFAADDLRESEKDRAENVMIVDLLRNDLAKVCTPESVFVSDLCRLETYEYVQHLVSVVKGKLQPDKTSLDLIRATFPGGSITGAPKVRAMEIIAELEPTARGPYCGSMGYIGFDGTMDLSILIRTVIAGKGWWQFPVGGGIVAQSTPRSEYAETWDKAIGMIRALPADLEP